MNVVFFCQSCGSRFEVDAIHAGKSARCKKCGQRAVVPKPSELASMAGLAAVPTAAPAAPAPKAQARRKPSAAARAASAGWIAAVNSSVALAPLTESALPMARRARPAGAGAAPGPAGYGNLDDWDDQDSKPYALATPVAPAAGRRGSKPVGRIKQGWRREIGSVQKIFRKLNETAYLLSVPFLMIIILGAAFRSRPIALMGAVVVVVLNLGRLVAGLANVLVIPFRDSPVQGLLFLVPPFMFTYGAKHWDNLEKPVRRVIGPALTLAAVVLAFAFIPSLRGDRATAAADPVSKLRAGVGDLKEAVRDGTGKARAGLDALETKAQAAGIVGGAGPGDSTPAPAQAPAPK